MISITKGSLTKAHAAKSNLAKERLCEQYDLNPKGYHTGKKTFTFSASSYAAALVKKRSKQAQHGKCAFCDSYFAHPGYYWLAYEWDNLFVSCQLCNQGFKQNLFPLRNARLRARTHRHDISAERPLLVNPATDNPALVIGFRQEYAYAIVDGDPVAKATIDVFGLNREGLVENRRRRLEVIRELLKVRDLLREGVTKPGWLRQLRSIEERLAASRAISGEYAAVSRAFIDALT